MRALALVLLATAALAKPVAETPLAEAIARASVICAATLVGHEFDDLKPGKVARTDNRFTLLKRYRVTEVFRDATGKVHLDSILSVRDKSNGCVVWTDQVSYESKTLTFRPVVPAHAVQGEPERLKVPVGKKVILLLDESNQHYGWFASPRDDDPELRARLPH